MIKTRFVHIPKMKNKMDKSEVSKKKSTSSWFTLVCRFFFFFYFQNVFSVFLFLIFCCYSMLLWCFCFRKFLSFLASYFVLCVSCYGIFNVFLYFFFRGFWWPLLNFINSSFSLKPTNLKWNQRKIASSTKKIKMRRKKKRIEIVDAGLMLNVRRKWIFLFWLLSFCLVWFGSFILFFFIRSFRFWVLFSCSCFCHATTNENNDGLIYKTEKKTRKRFFFYFASLSSFSLLWRCFKVLLFLFVSVSKTENRFHFNLN